MKPELGWDDRAESSESVVWRSQLDDRYLIEVVRTGERTANLRVFDHTNNDAVLLTEDVGLSYGAVFGPDVEDVSDWKDRVLRLIDGERNEN